MKYDKIKIGNRIKEIRIMRKNSILDTDKYNFCKTQELFAEKLGVDRRTIGKWENGDSLPSLEDLINMCDLLECNMEYFLGANDYPYVDTVSKCAHFTGIDPRIIDLVVKNPDFCDYLNFFMLPENCSNLFDKVTLNAWKKFWITESLSKIKEPLHNKIKKAFDKFYLSVPMSDITPECFKKFLIEFLPQNKINFWDENGDNSMIYVKNCFSTEIYEDFISNIPKENEYEYFIDYICSMTYETLKTEIYIELQKKKMSDEYILILEKYLTL